jgi:hypothetical protein
LRVGSSQTYSNLKAATTQPTHPPLLYFNTNHLLLVSMMMFPIPAALLFFALGASAAPKAEPMQVSVQQIARRDVWVPPIEEPTSQTTWYTGTQATVTWDASDPPQQISNPKGTILLGFLLANGTGGENLDVEHPLAQGFDLIDGEVSFGVPSNIEPGTNYIIALIGDSGNISPQFTIASSSN